MNKKQEEFEDELVNNSDKISEEQEDDNVDENYTSDNINSELDIYRKNIEPRSQDLGFKYNNRDLKLSNFGKDTEHWLNNTDFLATVLLTNYEPRGIFPINMHKIIISIRDRVLIQANSRDGFYQKLQQERTIRHHKITEDVSESKPVVVKRDKSEYDY